jgi:hypothetical protein
MVCMPMQVPPLRCSASCSVGGRQRCRRALLNAERRRPLVKEGAGVARGAGAAAVERWCGVCKRRLTAGARAQSSGAGKRMAVLIDELRSEGQGLKSGRGREASHNVADEQPAAVNKLMRERASDKGPLLANHIKVPTGDAPEALMLLLLCSGVLDAARCASGEGVLQAQQQVGELVACARPVSEVYLFAGSGDPGAAAPTTGSSADICRKISTIEFGLPCHGVALKTNNCSWLGWVDNPGQLRTRDEHDRIYHSGRGKVVVYMQRRACAKLAQGLCLIVKCFLKLWSYSTATQTLTKRARDSARMIPLTVSVSPFDFSSHSRMLAVVLSRDKVAAMPTVSTSGERAWQTVHRSQCKNGTNTVARTTCKMIPSYHALNSR